MPAASTTREALRNSTGLTAAISISGGCVPKGDGHGRIVGANRAKTDRREGRPIGIEFCDHCSPGHPLWLADATQLTAPERARTR
jgi:hypothetical protein